jgi:hypothetical protein
MGIIFCQTGKIILDIIGACTDILGYFVGITIANSEVERSLQ